MIVVGGDVLPGPMGLECLAALERLETRTRWIRGNGEADVLAAREGADIERVPEQVRDVVHWCGAALGPEDAGRIADWPAGLRVHLETMGEVFFCHASPRNDSDIFTAATPEAAIVDLFESVNAGVVVCGHTHMQFDRTVSTTRVVNAGSVGMPFGEPAAYWALLGPEVELRRTDYDLEDAAERVRGTEYPAANGFADRYILAPPSESKMTQLFERAAVGAV